MNDLETQKCEMFFIAELKQKIHIKKLCNGDWYCCRPRHIYFTDKDYYAALIFVRRLNGVGDPI